MSASGMSGEVPAVQSGNNASEFVRKLFRMLEDPSHQDVARWGKEGDTFVVVEGEKFTRSILPKHFKHSNMSSFIRQLNKYDFHKVKPSTDSEQSSPNGNVLEFKHPYFRIDSKDDLDHIRRKAPAPRKPAVAEDFTTGQHIGVLSDQLKATQQQVQQLQELWADMSQTNRLLVNEVMSLQKMLNAHKQAQHEMINYLTPFNENQHNMMAQQPINSNNAVSANKTDENVPELQRARELLSSVSTDSVADRELERLHGVYASPADSGSMITNSTMSMMNDPILADISRYPIYPVGQTIGIDPFHSDHVQKIPYAIPSDMTASTMSEPLPQPPQPQRLSMPTSNHTQPTTPLDKTGGSMWGPRKPTVLLVEDDPICAKIGVKFLKSMGCEVEHASNGADAYTRVSDVNRDPIDLVFMDIIMPRLDGVSATLYIRQHHSMPIIAMTSNIRPEEVNGYFDHGMNGVLAKPFTREGMHNSIKTNLSHLLKNAPNQDLSGGYFMSGQAFSSGHAMGSGGMKYEGQTPPAVAAWSPGGLPHQSPLGQGLDPNFNNFMNGSQQFNLTPSGTRAAQLQGSMDSPTGRMSDHDSPPGKRPRLNPGQHGFS